MNQPNENEKSGVQPEESKSPEPEVDDILKQTLPSQPLSLVKLELPNKQIDNVKGANTEGSVGSPPKGEASPNRFSTVTMSEVPQTPVPDAGLNDDLGRASEPNESPNIEQTVQEVKTQPQLIDPTTSNFVIPNNQAQIDTPSKLNMEESQTFIRDQTNAPIIEEDKKNLYDGEIQKIELMSDIPQINADSPQPHTRPNFGGGLMEQPPDIGFEDQNHMILETQGINDGPELNEILTARSGFDELGSARGLLPNNHRKFGSDLPSPIKQTMSPSRDLDSLKNINQSPSYPAVNEPITHDAPIIQKTVLFPQISSLQPTKNQSSKAIQPLPNIYGHKQRLDLDDIRRFDVDEINLSKRSKAVKISPRHDRAHPQECLDRFEEAQRSEIDSLDAYREYINTKDKGERKQIQNTFMSINTPFGQLVGKRRRLMFKSNKNIVDETVQPQIIYNDRDYKNRLGFLRLKTDRMEAMSLWKTNDIIGNNRMRYIKEIQKKNDHILSIKEKDSLEKLEVYEDTYPLLKIRKAIWKFCIYVKLISKNIISTSTFDNISITVILLNSIVMMSEDPTDADPPAIMEQIDKAFLMLYSIEMIFKILGLGFIYGEEAYLKDSWNILDFVIVMSGYVTLIMDQNTEPEGIQTGSPGEAQSSGGVDLSGLRVFRVLRPLKTITSIKGLKVLVTAILSAIPMLKDTVIILMFFFIIFAIGGTQLMAGSLKNRCVAIQTGDFHPDDIICGSKKSICPGGYFCGKANDNPNYGVTSFDNILYSLLCVFQSVTLEGWSEIQRDMQRAYMYEIFLYFLPLVFIGAFFLLNLTLAVINAKFTEAHHRQEEQDAQNRMAMTRIDNDKDGTENTELETVMNTKDELSLTQFIIARKCAKKMITFLRLRQQQKKEKLEQEKREKEAEAAKFAQEMEAAINKKKGNFNSQKNQQMLKQKFTMMQALGNSQKIAKDEQNKSQVSGDEPALGVAATLFGGAIISKKRKKKGLAKQGTIIKEELDDAIWSGQEEFEDQVHDFLKQTKSRMQQEQQMGRTSVAEITKSFDLVIPPKPTVRVWKKKRQQNSNQLKNITNTELLNKAGLKQNIKMKGIVGLKGQFEHKKKIYKNEPPKGSLSPMGRASPMGKALGLNQRQHGKRNSMGQQIDFEKDLDLDQIIPVEYRKEEQTIKDDQPQDIPIENSFSIKDEYDHDEHNFYQKPEDPDATGKVSMINVAISSDSEFDNAGPQNSEIPQGIKSKQTSMNVKQRMIKKFKDDQMGDIETQDNLTIQYDNKKVNRVFKKMLTLQGEICARTAIAKNNSSTDMKQTEVGNVETANEEAKSSKNGNIEDEILKNYKLNIQKRSLNKQSIMNHKTIKLGDNYKVVEIKETINTKEPENPFADVTDKGDKKVHITEDVQYKGTSQNDVFQPRIMGKGNSHVFRQNEILKIPEDQMQDYDPDRVQKAFIRSQFEPWQQKIWYNAIQDSSELEAGEQSDDEDFLCSQEQPYQTVTSVNYEKLMRKAPIKELAKRSDILITSTVSLSVFPVDNRVITQQKRSMMSFEDVETMVDERCAFTALCKGHEYRVSQTKDKDKLFRDNYIKSMIYKQDFTAKCMTKFKEQVMNLNLTRKPPPIIDESVQKAEMLKHNQQLRASEKRGIPYFTLELALKLLNGTYHDEDEEEQLNFETEPIKRSQMTEKQLEEAHQKQMSKFEEQFKLIEDIKEKQEDEIPKTLRKEFQIPENIGKYEIDFDYIRKVDYSKRKFRPIWSGQDVLPDILNYEKSISQCIDKLNSIRVWPSGSHGILKRIRYVLRKFEGNPLFDTSMTFAVLLNTIVLSMDRYGIPETTENLLNTFNSYFTYIFICEMGIKLLARGIKKYCADPMNGLDGFVVIMSIVELAFMAMGSGSMNRSTFQTIRVFRTFRVFRIARLLRSLESMKTILGVISRSYKSFIYITLLLFVFIFIYSLLGMQVFGGNFDYDDGKPRGNYDSFAIAGITVFQVLTMENWIAVLQESMRGDLNKFITSAYYISWIFLGNFILLNLFLAILLDSFLEEEDEPEGSEEEILNRKKAKQLRAQQRKMRKQRKIVLMGSAGAEPSKKYFGQAKGESEEDLEDLDEEQITYIFKEQGYMQKDKSELENQPLYNGVECQASFYVFDKENFIRQKCYVISGSKLWDNTVMALICASSLKLAFDTYFMQETERTLITEVSEIIDYFFNYSFIVEMGTKLIAQGLIMDEGSYLREAWNQLDFFIVTSSIFDMSLQGKDLKFIKILRLLRILRPLRFISHNVALKMIVVALLESMGGIFNVTIVVLMIWLIFAIMGVNTFGGKFFYCSIDMYTLSTRMECEYAGGQWMIYDHNFDNVFSAMKTLFIVSSLEGWPDIMLQSVDAVAQDVGPTLEASVVNAIYFVIFILIGSFFFLNFFIGVLFLKYNQAQKEEQKGYSDKDMSWMDIQRLILAAGPEYETTNFPSQRWRQKFHILVSSDRFDKIIMGCIVLNMVQMAVFSEGQLKVVGSLLDFTNLIFTAIFIIEAGLKIVAFGGSYLNNSWNKFDFFVVVSSIFDILLGKLDMQSMELLSKIGPQIARVMRVLRVTRVLRLAGKAKGLQAIIQTIMFSIPSLVNVFMLLMLIFFMFSIMGVFSFGTITDGEVLDDLKNFNNFQDSFLLLFAITTGEDWNKIMFDCSRTAPDCVPKQTCGNKFAWIYFFLIILACSHVMLNLFILVIIQQFEKYYLPTDNMITLFKNDQANFMQAWKIYTQERYQCFKIKEKQLLPFFRMLGEIGNKETSLGFSQEFYDEGELKKQLLKMGIKSENGFIYFNELLYRCMRRKYGNFKINKKMQIFELRTQFQIYQKTLFIQNKGLKRLQNQEIFNSIVKKESGVNPFLTVMNFKISFKTWIKYAKLRMRKQAFEMLMNTANEATMQRQKALLEEDGKIKQFAVEIENEHIYSCTSEEEDELDAFLRNKSEQQNQENKEGAMQMADKISQMNHLELFEQKMSQKFKRMQTQKSKSVKLDGKFKQSPNGNMAQSLVVEGAKQSIHTGLQDQQI